MTRTQAGGNDLARLFQSILCSLRFFPFLSVSFFFCSFDASAEPINNPDTFTELTISDIDSLDPDWAYDAASGEVILNIYETLLAFDKSSTDRLVPVLAERIPSRANGLLSKGGRTYVFPLRRGVRFQDGSPMTPEDVRYSLLRFVLLDRDAGPSWILAQPLLGFSSTRDQGGKLRPDAFRRAARAIRVKGNSLVLRLPKPFAPLLSALATWAPVIPKEWAVRHGEWDGREETLLRYNNPDKQRTYLHDHANGTGPFKLERWDRRAMEVVLRRNPRYWRPPAKLKRVVIRSVKEFETRKLELAAGDADSIYAAWSDFGQLKEVPGVRIIEGVPTMEVSPIVFFGFLLNARGNPYAGSGALDGEGIPPDFFSNRDIRMAFAHALDYEGFIRDVTRGRGIRANGCIPEGFLGHDSALPYYRFDLGRSRELLRRAMNGEVWKRGFRFSIVYTAGNEKSGVIARMLKRGVEGLNARFRIDVRPLEWPAFLDGYAARRLPIFIAAWQADYPDPHNFAFPLMGSKGYYPRSQGYARPEADRLIARAQAEISPAARRRLYGALQKIEHDDVPHLLTQYPVLYRTQRDWVRGWYPNPVFPDSPYGSYYYPLYKAQ